MECTKSLALVVLTSFQTVNLIIIANCPRYTKKYSHRSWVRDIYMSSSFFGANTMGFYVMYRHVP